MMMTFMFLVLESIEYGLLKHIPGLWKLVPDVKEPAILLQEDSAVQLRLLLGEDAHLRREKCSSVPSQHLSVYRAQTGCSLVAVRFASGSRLLKIRRGDIVHHGT
jgi:hypothetical protein